MPKDDEGSCTSTDVTKLLQNSEATVTAMTQAYAGYYGEDFFCPFIEEPAGSEIRRYHHGNFFRLAASQSPSKIWRAAAAGKISTRRLISRIILESVVNASSRRRRGLASRGDLFVSRANTSIGQRSFSIAAPVVWNALPRSTRPTRCSSEMDSH